jgi:hypothetical protein
MNVLILTPDRVGSTLLQRVLTIYMNSISSDKVVQPVVNLHELSNRIENYYSEKFQKDMTGKPKEWDYRQTLPEVTEVLKNTTHAVTSRLAHYHLVRRNDSMPEQTDFYRYLNDNFFIIGCRRNSVFEHALSWGISGHSNELNVYSHKDKITRFNELYKNQISIPKNALLKHLNAYKRYIEWADTYFNINEFFIYEENMPSIDSFVKNLDCFNNIAVSNWNKMFGMSWSNWNRCHRLLSDLGSTASGITLLENNSDKDKELPAIRDIITNLPAIEQQFLEVHATTYLNATGEIDKLVKDRIMVTGVPIKLQTLVEKKMMIKNFSECAIIYNEWADENGFPIIKDNQEIVDQAYNELKNWYTEVPNTLKLQ